MIVPLQQMVVDRPVIASYKTTEIMPRVKSESRMALVDSALALFWRNGYHVVSMGDLVRETGVGRGGIYSDFSGKEELFHACLERYQETVVSELFSSVEAEDAGLDAIETHLQSAIQMIIDSDEPSYGCLVVNTLAQIEPEEIKTRELLESHIQRIHNGFHSAIANENKANRRLTKKEVAELAEFMTVSIQGLASYSRANTDIKQLRRYCQTLIKILRTQLHGK